jgi:hypothetical protein
MTCGARTTQNTNQIPRHPADRASDRVLSGSPNCGVMSFRYDRFIVFEAKSHPQSHLSASGGFKSAHCGHFTCITISLSRCLGGPVIRAVGRVRRICNHEGHDDHERKHSCPSCRRGFLVRDQDYRGAPAGVARGILSSRIAARQANVARTMADCFSSSSLMRSGKSALVCLVRSS